MTFHDELNEIRRRAGLPIMEAGLVSRQAAAKYVAADDELFDAIASYVGSPDYYDDLPEESKKKFLSILQRVRPFKKRLYRGEPSNDFNNFQPYSDQFPRGFSSWSAAQDVPEKWFRDSRDHIVKYTDGPIKALSLEDIVYWRTVLTNQSIYGGMQAEYFVLEPVVRKVEGY